jgi:hypothetical protein
MMLVGEPHVVVHLNRFRQYPETGMEFMTMAPRKNAKSVSAPVAIDASQSMLDLVRGFNPEQLATLRAALAQVAQVPPVAPVAQVPPVAPIAPIAPLAPIAAIKLPTPITQAIEPGNYNIEVICVGVSPVRWGYGKPTRIVNFVHEATNIGFVAYEPGTETEFRVGANYGIEFTHAGKMSPVYQGVSNNVIKITSHTTT